MEEVEMLKYKKRGIRKMSLRNLVTVLIEFTSITFVLEFCKDVNKDAAKSILILPKIILEWFSLWPGKENVAIKAINYAYFSSLCIMEIAHITYLFAVIKNVPEVAKTGTTVSSTFQTILKLFSLRYHKKSFNKILSIIWNDFWPVEISSKETQKSIKQNIFLIKVVCLSYLGIGIISVTQYMSFPIIVGNEKLPLASIYPFDHKKLPYFEIFYLWQLFSNFLIVCILSGYDFFFSSIAMNVVAQFQILQDVMRNIYVDDDATRKKMYRILKVENSSSGRSIESEMFLKCINHHKLLLSYV